MFDLLTAPNQQTTHRALLVKNTFLTVVAMLPPLGRSRSEPGISASFAMLSYFASSEHIVSLQVATYGVEIHSGSFR